MAQDDSILDLDDLLNREKATDSLVTGNGTAPPRGVPDLVRAVSAAELLACGESPLHPPDSPASHDTEWKPASSTSAPLTAEEFAEVLRGQHSQPSRTAGPDSPAMNQTRRTTGEMTGDALTRETDSTAGTQGMGNITPSRLSEPTAVETRARTRGPLEVTKRLQAEGRWKEVEPVRDQMMRDAKAAYPDKQERQNWVYSELDRMYPPPEFVTQVPNSPDPKVPRLPEAADTGQIQGLNDLPGDWPELAANASLAADVGWVQANRLRVVREKPGGATVVSLDRALSAAPSWAALGWLETSIRSYAKFVDVVARASGADDEGESAVLRRERRSIEEVRALLDEMKAAEGTCERCGRPF